METIGRILVVIAITLVTSLILSIPVMLLWNWLMPKIFGLITISLWESMGVITLSSLLFKNSNSND